MVNPSRFAFDPWIDKPWGSTLREKLPRSVRLRYVNWRFKKRQQAFLAPSLFVKILSISPCGYRPCWCKISLITKINSCSQSKNEQEQEASNLYITRRWSSTIHEDSADLHVFRSS